AQHGAGGGVLGEVEKSPSRVATARFRNSLVPGPPSRAGLARIRVVKRLLRNSVRAYIGGTNRAKSSAEGTA
ncbi:MAG: hypothetical protein WCC87_13460, partial [Candidatus Korobacteraceae bacterium]